LHLPPDQSQQRPESQMARSLYDCPPIPVGPEGKPCRVIVATHPAGKKKSPVGVTRSGVVYELFFTNLTQRAFTASDVVELYLHRGAFEPTLFDEDQEIDPDRWCSHSARGQECWQIVSQWVWNEAPGTGPSVALLRRCAAPSLPQHTSPQQISRFSHIHKGLDRTRKPCVGRAGRFSGRDAGSPAKGTLRFPAGQSLSNTCA